jgi:hypothetical protein
MLFDFGRGGFENFHIDNVVSTIDAVRLVTTDGGVKRRAEQSDYYKSRERQTEHVRSVAAFPTAK